MPKEKDFKTSAQTNIPVFLVIVQPRNQIFCNYQINGNKETHSKKYEELAVYLGSLVPEQIPRIDELINLKRPFILLVEEKKVQELSLDLAKEMELYKTNLNKQNFNSIMNYDPNSIKDTDSLIKKISFDNSYEKYL